MRSANDRRKGEQGFTLIEIIAVLVILGILAAVAIPKYNDLQKQAQFKTAMGAIPALVTTATNDYHSAVLASPNIAEAWGQAQKTTEVGDFIGSYSAAGNVVKVGVTTTKNATLTWWSNMSGSLGSGNMTYQFSLPGAAAAVVTP